MGESMNWAIQAVIAALIFVSGAAGGVKWQLGVQARKDVAAAEARQSDAIQQRKFGDKAATTHAATLAAINNKLGNAREQIAKLSGRECLDAGTVGLLNTIGDQPVRAATGEPAGAPGAAASGAGLRFATDRDTASAIAICRARFAEVTSQVNQILDIEEKRHPVGEP